MSFFLIWRFYFVCFLWRRRAQETLLSLINSKLWHLLGQEWRLHVHSLSPVWTLRRPWSSRPHFDPLLVWLLIREESVLSAFRRFRGRQAGKEKNRTGKGKWVGNWENLKEQWRPSLFSFFFFYHGHFKTQNFPQYCNIPPMCSSPSFKSRPPKAVSFHLCALSPIRVYSSKSQHHVSAFIDISMWISERLFRNYVNCV